MARKSLRDKIEDTCEKLAKLADSTPEMKPALEAAIKQARGDFKKTILQEVVETVTEAFEFNASVDEVSAAVEMAHEAAKIIAREKKQAAQRAADEAAKKAAEETAKK